MASFYKILLVIMLAVMANRLPAYAEDEDVPLPPLPSSQPAAAAAPNPFPAPAANPVPVRPAAGLNNSPVPAVPAGSNVPVVVAGKPMPGRSAARLPLKSTANSTLPVKNKNETIPPVFNRSLMFTPADLEKIKEVYKVYLARLANQNEAVPGNVNKGLDLLSRLNLTSAAPTLPPAPIGIYLNSILFRGTGNAAAWINGKKYEIGSEDSNVKLLSATASSVAIEWRVTGFKDSDYNDWSAIFPQVGDKDAAKIQAALPPSRQSIEVDSQTKTVHVVLKPNQYLDIQAKAVKEGKPKLSSDGSTPKWPVLPVQPAATQGPGLIKPPISQSMPVINPLPDSTMPGAAANPDDKKISYKLSPDGHYNVPAMINGQTINFRVDTGATYPVISKDDAQRIGVNVDALQYNFEAKIANGDVVKSAQTTIDTMNLGNLSFNNVSLMVADGPFPQPLLGMSFLKNVTIANDTLTIKQ